jgi:4'-phosphopantetheinyl transferase
MESAAADEKHPIAIWIVSLQATNEQKEQLAALLSSDEKTRKDRFVGKPLQDAFTMSRGALRVILGQALAMKPDAVQFQYGRHGKPQLAQSSSWCFNSSHTNELFSCALTRDCEIGIDIEQTKPLPDAEAIARSYFCPEELADLHTLSNNEEQQEAFYRCWTRKEDYLKATGTGLWTDLNSFQVTLLPHADPAFIHVGHSDEEAKHWTIQELSDIPGHSGAIAYRDRPRRLQRSSIFTVGQLLEL